MTLLAQSLQYDGNSGIFVHSGMEFSTHDQDNDLAPYNCASGREGAWWYNYCFYACVTCGTSYHEWDTLGDYYLTNSRMMIKPHE